MIASHNSWTYRPPIRTWMWLLVPFAKCQRKSIEQQLDAGVEMFDLRLKLYNKNMSVAHGPYVIKADFLPDLSRIDYADSTQKYVRVLMESRNPTYDEIILFKHYCEWIKFLFPNIIFFGGHGAHKPNWRAHYYDFGTQVPKVEEYHASVRGGFMPWLWGLRRWLSYKEFKRWEDKRNDKKNTTMLDFV